MNFSESEKIIHDWDRHYDDCECEMVQQLNLLQDFRLYVNNCFSSSIFIVFSDSPLGGNISSNLYAYLGIIGVIIVSGAVVGFVKNRKRKT